MGSYTVGTLRAAGLEARWSRTRRGAPIIAARDPHGRERHQRETWWIVDRWMWEAMAREGVRGGFDSATLLGDIFSVP